MIIDYLPVLDHRRQGEIRPGEVVCISSSGILVLTLISRQMYERKFDKPSRDRDSSCDAVRVHC